MPFMFQLCVGCRAALKMPPFSSMVTVPLFVCPDRQRSIVPECPARCLRRVAVSERERGARASIPAARQVVGPRFSGRSSRAAAYRLGLPSTWTLAAAGGRGQRPGVVDGLVARGGRVSISVVPLVEVGGSGLMDIGVVDLVGEAELLRRLPDECRNRRRSPPACALALPVYVIERIAPSRPWKFS